MDPVRQEQLREQISQKYLGEVYTNALESIHSKCWMHCIENKDELSEKEKCCMDRCTDRLREAHREVSDAFCMRLDQQYAGKKA